ncbi:hypothetical protein Dimus_010421, partial [Dionaea muscipula]
MGKKSVGADSTKGNDDDDHGGDALATSGSVPEVPVQPEIPSNTDAPTQAEQPHEDEQEVEQEAEEIGPNEHHEEEEAKNDEDVMENTPQADE